MIQTPLKRVLFGRTQKAIAMGVFSAFIAVVSLTSVITLKSQTAEAATSRTLNFQARLLTSAGSIVPDGNYNIEFKLYDAASAGTLLWTETRYDSNGVTAGNDNRVQVKAGYVSVYLGDVNDLPSNIWNKQLWLTMNIGGLTQTATPAYDGEMNPRLRLTAVPSAYSLTNYNSVTGFSSSLAIAGATGGDQEFVIPDQGAAGTYNLLTTVAANNSYIQLQGATPGTAQTGNFNITGAGIAGSIMTTLLDTASAAALNIGTTNASAINLNQSTAVASGKSLTVTAGSTTLTGLGAGGSPALTVNTGAANNKGIVIKADASQSVALLQITDSSNATLVAVDELGNLFAQGITSNDTIEAITYGGTHQALAVTQNAASATAPVVTIAAGATPGAGANLLQLQDASGNINAKFNNTGAQLTLGRIASSGTVTQGKLILSDGTTSNFGATIESATLTADRRFILPDTALATTASPGTICVYNGSASNCPAATGSAFYIQNGTTVQTAANFYVRSATTTDVGAVIEGANGQTANLLNLNTYNGSSSTTVASVSNTGALTAAGVNSTTGLLQGTGGFTLTGTAQINATGAGTTTIGSSAAGTIALQSGSASGITLTSNNAAGGVFVQSAVNGTTAFQVRDSNGAAALTVDTTPDSGNFIANGSLETNTTGWAVKGSGSIARTTASSFFGSAALSITTTGANDGAKYDVTLLPNTQYTVNMMGITTGSNWSTLAYGYAADGSTETDCKTGQALVTTGYKLFNCTFTTPATISGTPYFYIKQTGASAHTFYMDAIQLRAGGNVGVFRDTALKIDSAITSPVGIMPSTDTTLAFNVESSDGSTVLVVDTLNKRVGVGTQSPAANLTVARTTGDDAQLQARINTTSTQTGDLLQFYDETNSAVLTNVSADASLTVKQRSATTTAFQVQGTSGSFVTADATNNQLILGNTTLAGKLLFSDGSNNTATLEFLPSAADVIFQLPAASAGTYAICTSTNNCNYSTSLLTDNVTDALDIQEGTNNYININTTNSSENISFGNATTNPTYNFLGSGLLTAGRTLVKPTGATTSALEVKDSSNNAIFGVDATNRKVTVGAYTAGNGIGQFMVQPTTSSRVGLSIVLASGATVDALQVYEAGYTPTGAASGDNVIFRISETGVIGSPGSGTASTRNTSLRSGDTSFAGGTTGVVNVQSGANTGSGNTGATNILTGNATSGNSGALNLNTGDATGTVGAVTIKPGTSSNASSTGANTNVSGGDISGTTSATGGALNLQGGSATGASGTRNGGAVSIQGGTGATANGAVNIQANLNGNTNINTGTSTGAVTIGNGTSTAGAVQIQGSASSYFSATNATGTTRFNFAAPSTAGTVTFQLPAGGTGGNTYDICTTLSVCTGYAPSTGGNYIAKNATDTSSAAVVGALLGLTNTDTSSSARVLDLSNAGTGSTLNVASSANAAAAAALIKVNLTNGSPSGNLLDLQTNSVSKFSVSAAGVVTLVGGQTSDITTASGASATGISLQPGGSTGASSNGGAVSIKAGDGSGTTSVTGGALTLQGGSATGASGTRNGGAVSILGGTGANANGAVNIQVNLNGNTNINTGTSTGSVSIGNSAAGSISLQSAGTISLTGTTNINTSGTANTVIGNATGTFQLDSNTLDISSGGAITGATGITMASGNFLQNGSGTFGTGSGAVSLNGAVTAATTLAVNGSTTLGSGAGVGQLTNNGSTLNTTLALGDLAAGSIGTAAATVDIYTSFSISPTASGRTYTIPAPTDGLAGRVIYVSNINATNSFIIGGTTFNAHSTATLVYDGTSWNFAGMDGGSNNYIQNQNAADQTANFRVNGAGTFNPTGNSVTPLTVNATTGTAATAAVINQSQNANGLNVVANALTTAVALSVSSSGTGLTSGSLISATTATTGALATNGVVSIQATGNYTSTSNTGLLNVAANSTTAGTIANIQGNALTTGVGMNLSSTSTGLTSGSVLRVSSATTGAVATNGIVSINATGNYTSTSNTGLLNVAANSTNLGTIVNIQGNALTDGTALNVSSTSTSLALGYLARITTATTGNLNGGGALVVDATGNFGQISNNALINFNANSTTDGVVQKINANALTTGKGLIIQSTGTGLTSGSLLTVTSATTGAVTNGVANIIGTGNFTTTGNGALLTVAATTTTAGTVARFSGDSLTTGNGVVVTSTSTGLTSGSLLNVNTATTGALATNGVVSIQATGNYTSTSNTGLLNVNASATTAGTVANIQGAALTTGTALNIAATALTTGSALTVTSNSTANAILSNGNITFGELTGTRTLGTQARTTNVAGTNLTVSAGAAGTGASAFSGGSLTLQGGAAAGTGNANGGSVAISGGAGTGTGVLGLISLAPTNFLVSGATQVFSSDGSVTGVDSASTIPISASNTGRTITIPAPNAANQVVGRILYVANVGATNDLTILLAGTSVTIALKPNSTATLIWNGNGWTAAGASSSTDLQAAYNNTATNAGAAELILNAAGGAADGLTIRNNATTPIVGSLLEVQTSIGSNLFSVNNNATEYANNGGAESSTFTMWTASPTGGTTATVSRTTAAGTFATGQAAAQVVTTGATTANQGIANTLTSTLTANLVYSVAFTVKTTSNFSTLDVVYSRDGTNTSTTACATGKTATQSYFTRIECSFTAPATGITASNAIFIRQSNSNTTARTFYVDNLSVTINANTSHASDGSVNAALGTNWTAYDADGGAGTSSPVLDTTNIYDTSGAVAVTTTTGAGAGEGVRNAFSITPQINTQYLVTFYAKSTTAFSDITVGFLPAAGSSLPVSAQLCTDYNTQTVSTTGFVKITCVITTPASGITTPQLVIYQGSSAARTFYIDALTITLNTNNSSNVQIGGGKNGGPTTLFTLDRAASAPIAANNDAYLGSMYFDTTTGRIQCYEADGWGACGAAPDNIVNLNPEFPGAVLNGTKNSPNNVGTMNADFCGNGAGLSINTGLCASGEARNFYQWTSPQASQQTYSVYVTYQLPATFNGFSDDNTVQLTGRADDITKADVTYEMFKSQSGTLTQCGTGETDVTTTNNTWQTVGLSGNEATGCSFNSTSAGAFLIFKINVKAQGNANAYVGTLSFTTTNK